MRRALVWLDVVLVISVLLLEVRRIREIRVCGSPKVNEAGFATGEEVLVGGIVVTAPDNLIVTHKVDGWREFVVCDGDASEAFSGTRFRFEVKKEDKFGD